MLLWIALAVLSLGAEAGQDWPQWRGPARDGIVAAPAVPEVWPEKLSEAWSVEVEGGLASPVVRNGVAFLLTRNGEEERSSAHAITDGRRLWQHRYSAPFVPNPHMNPPGQFPVSQGHGPFATPCLSGDRVIALGSARTLSCVAAHDGELLWQRSFYPQPVGERSEFVCLPCGQPCDDKIFEKGGSCPDCRMALAPKGLDTSGRYYGAASSPLVVEGTGFVHVGTGEEGRLIAFDAATGETKWELEEPPGYSSPIHATLAGRSQIIALSREAAIGVAAASGRELWRYPLGPRAKVMTPVVHDGLVIVSGYQRPTQALRITAGEAGAVEVEEAWSSDRTLYMSSPLVIDGVLYGFSSKRQGQLFALEATSGELLWEGEARQGENAALVGWGSVVLALTTEGRLIVFRASKERFEEVAQYEVSETPTWAHPAVVDEGILIKSADRLTLWRPGDR